MNHTKPIRFSAARHIGRGFVAANLCFIASTSLAETTNTAVVSLSATSLPDAGPSLVRLIGALAMVLAIFFGGVWLFRNWQRLSLRRGHVPKLNLVETRSLGARTAIYVVGYERDRFLVAASPAGVSLLTHLPAATEEESLARSNASASMPFAQALAEVLKRK